MTDSFNKKPGNPTPGGVQSSRVNLPPAVISSISGNNAASTTRNVKNGALTQHSSHGMFDEFYLLLGKKCAFGGRKGTIECKVWTFDGFFASKVIFFLLVFRLF